MDLMICIDKYDIVRDGIIYYEKLFELGKKITTISACSDLDSGRIYRINEKFYISITASEECIKCLEKEDIINEDQLSKMLEKNGLTEIPDEDIFEYDTEMQVKIQSKQSCNIQ